MIQKYEMPKFDNKATNDKSIIVARSISTGDKFYILAENDDSYIICDEIWKTKGQGFGGIHCKVWKKGFAKCVHPICEPLKTAA